MSFDPSLVGPARAKRITIMCRKLHAAQALSWGLVDELARTGRTLEKALGMAEVVLSMPQPTVRMVKEAINATANALHGVSAFADADQSQLTASSRSAKAAPGELSREVGPIPTAFASGPMVRPPPSSVSACRQWPAAFPIVFLDRRLTCIPGWRGDGLHLRPPFVGASKEEKPPP